MRVLLSILNFCIFFSFLTNESLANATWWKCFCFLQKGDCIGRITPPGTHPRVMPNLEIAEIGVKAEVQIGKMNAIGIITDATFEGIVLKQFLGEKEVETLIPHKKIDSIKILDSDVSTNTFGDTFEILKTRLQARRKYLDFINTDFFSPIKNNVIKEVLKLRTIKGSDAREEYLRLEANKITSRVKEKFGIDNIGFHYNLNGGTAINYVDSGGLRVSRGDVGVQYGASTDYEQKIYMFQTKFHGLYDVVSATNPKIVFGGRMGSVLNIFSLDNNYIRKANDEGGIPKSTNISSDFNMSWLKKQDFNRVGNGGIGIPYSIYLAPPISVFTDLSKNFRELKRLSRDDETLITLRQIESILLSEKSYLP